jgi:hypothetical protein
MHIFHTVYNKTAGIARRAYCHPPASRQLNPGGRHGKKQEKSRKRSKKAGKNLDKSPIIVYHFTASRTGEAP